MELPEILGKLPASDSPSGELGKTDYMKVTRMGIVIVASYVVTAVLTTLIHDISGGAFGIPAELTTPIVGVLSLILETVRRKLA